MRPRDEDTSSDSYMTDEAMRYLHQDIDIQPSAYSELPVAIHLLVTGLTANGSTRILKETITSYFAERVFDEGEAEFVAPTDLGPVQRMICVVCSGSVSIYRLDARNSFSTGSRRTRRPRE